MKRILSYLLIATISVWSVIAYADITIKKDNTNPPIGRFEILNVKTGGSGQVASSGETATIDETNLTGVNWQALNAAAQTINWTGAQIAANSGLNWVNQFPTSNQFVWNTGLPANNPTLGGVNWATFTVENSNINWLDIQTAQSNRSGVNWTYLDIYTGGLNWNTIGRGATAGNIVCWTTGGQLGKCTGSVSGVGCVGCQ